MTNKILDKEQRRFELDFKQTKAGRYSKLWVYTKQETLSFFKDFLLQSNKRVREETIEEVIKEIKDNDEAYDFGYAGEDIIELIQSLKNTK